MHILKGVVWEDDAFRFFMRFALFLPKNRFLFSFSHFSSDDLTLPMKMKKLVQLVAALALIKAVSALEQKPNVVFVFSDDHAPHAIGAYDGWLKSVNPTPVIDRLASEGMLFVNSFCTNSICGPSRAVIQTGKHSHKNGFMNNGNTFDWNQQTFPKLLQKACYQSAIFV